MKTQPDLLQAAQGALHLCQSLLACREGATDGLIMECRNALQDAIAMRESNPNIRVEITDESELHCLKLVFQSRNIEQPLEIFLHTRQAVDLVHKLSLVICELHHRDSEMLLRLKQQHGTTKDQ